ncbi:hypothetical protein [Immundisolibacter sp.]|uniref:hypothetical protein n=1 Tax=Immundisolibacter sp. TaxID=1934948 RepID=UPI00356AC2E0
MLDLTNSLSHLPQLLGDIRRLGWGTIRRVAMRANVLLPNRTQEEIFEAAKVIDWMVAQCELLRGRARPGEYFLEIGGDLRRELEPTLAWLYFSDAGFAKGLFELRDLFDLTDLKSIEGVGWEELFAVLALCLSCSWREGYEALEQSRGARSVLQVDRALSLGELAADAVEAIWYAETLAVKDIDQAPKLEIEVIRRISLQSQQAAIARHARTNALKTEFLQFAQNLSGISKREIATSPRFQ